MSNFKIELNSAGIQALLKSPEIMSALEEPAEKIRATMGDKFAIDRHIGKTRGNVSVYTTDSDAMQEEMQNNKLIKAVGGYFRTNKSGTKTFTKASKRKKK